VLPPTVAVKARRDPSGENFGSISAFGVDVSRRALSAAAGHGPQVAAVFERDQLAADRRPAQQSGALRQRGVAERENRDDGQRDCMGSCGS
jgi:hypothetical protein